GWGWAEAGMLRKRVWADALLRTSLRMSCSKTAILRLRRVTSVSRRRATESKPRRAAPPWLLLPVERFGRKSAAASRSLGSPMPVYRQMRDRLPLRGTPVLPQTRDRLQVRGTLVPLARRALPPHHPREAVQLLP